MLTCGHQYIDIPSLDILRQLIFRLTLWGIIAECTILLENFIRLFFMFNTFVKIYGKSLLRSDIVASFSAFRTALCKGRRSYEYLNFSELFWSYSDNYKLKARFFYFKSWFVDKGIFMNLTNIYDRDLLQKQLTVLNR